MWHQPLPAGLQGGYLETPWVVGTVRWTCCLEAHRVNNADSDSLHSVALLPVTTMKTIRQRVKICGNQEEVGLNFRRSWMRETPPQSNRKPNQGLRGPSKSAHCLSLQTHHLPAFLRFLCFWHADLAISQACQTQYCHRIFACSVLPGARSQWILTQQFPWL